MFQQQLWLKTLLCDINNNELLIINLGNGSRQTGILFSGLHKGVTVSCQETLMFYWQR
jgi:hypothetical protein